MRGFILQLIMHWYFLSLEFLVKVFHPVFNFVIVFSLKCFRYYEAPSGKKLRSMVEVQKYIFPLMNQISMKFKAFLFVMCYYFIIF